MNICTKPFNGHTCAQQVTLHIDVPGLVKSIDEFCRPCRIDRWADLAMAAVHGFADAAGMRDENGYTDDLQSIVADLLCDLMHYADREEISMTEAHTSACRNYLAELAELTPRPKGEWGIRLHTGEWARVKNGVFDQTGTELYRSNNYWARRKANGMGTTEKIPDGAA